MERTAIVVGAGIAGLASALSLARTGWRVTVLERAPKLGEVGAGFAMSRNAVAAFRGLGFDDDAVAALGFPTWAEGTWDLHGRPILTIPDKPAVREAVALVGVHRRRLHEALLRGARAAGVEVVTGTLVTTLDPGRPDAALAVVDGREGRLVVVADGMNSAVRAALFPGSEAIYSGYSSWRAITPRVFGETTLRQFWGPHAEFGIMPVSETETYWYGYVAMPERTAIEDELSTAQQRFAGCGPAGPGDLGGHRAGRGHAPRRLSPAGRAAALFSRSCGDGGRRRARLPPDHGPGAARRSRMGCASGSSSARPSTHGESLATALAGYDAARRPRCRALGRSSIATARFGSHLGGGRRQTVRNALMRLVPSGAITRGARAAMGWLPPEVAAPSS